MAYLREVACVAGANVKVGEGKNERKKGKGTSSSPLAPCSPGPCLPFHASYAGKGEGIVECLWTTNFPCKRFSKSYLLTFPKLTWILHVRYYVTSQLTGAHLF